MKRILLTIIILFIASHFFYSLDAQTKDDKKKEKKLVIKIDKNVNGKMTKVDTTIVLKDGDDVDKILEKYDLADGPNMHHTKTFNMKFDDGDTSKMNNMQKMVWVTIDDENGDAKDKSTRSKIFVITDDGDGSEMHMENGNVMIFKDKAGKDFKNMDDFSFETGDSLNFDQQVIIHDDSHKKHKKVYKYKNDSTSSKTKVFVFSDENDMDHMRMQGDDDVSDSSIIIIKKYKDGKESVDTKKIIKKKKQKMVMIKIIDADKDDLTKLKLKANYKKLDINGFNINLINDKMSLNFELKEKANTSIKLIDKEGKTVFGEDLKQFSGKYSKELDALKGEFYIQINQGNKFYIRKVILDFN